LSVSAEGVAVAFGKMNGAVFEPGELESFGENRGNKAEDEFVDEEGSGGRGVADVEFS
jgi:hypothetical protein